MIPDVNVVLAAARPDHEHHLIAAQWWREALSEATPERPIRLLPVVVSGFLRVVTHPKVFATPSPINAAVAHVDALLTLPNVIYESTNGDWPTFKKLCVDRSLTGNRIPDAWIAAVVDRLGEHLATFDKDFRKLLPRSRLTVLGTTRLVP